MHPALNFLTIWLNIQLNRVGFLYTSDRIEEETKKWRLRHREHQMKSVKFSHDEKLFSSLFVFLRGHKYIFPSFFFRLCFIYHFEIRFWQNLIPNWCSSETKLKSRKSFHQCLCPCRHDLKANYPNEKHCFVLFAKVYFCFVFIFFSLLIRFFFHLFLYFCSSFHISLGTNGVKIIHSTIEVKKIEFCNFYLF